MPLSTRRSASPARRGTRSAPVPRKNTFPPSSTTRRGFPEASNENPRAPLLPPQARALRLDPAELRRLEVREERDRPAPKLVLPVVLLDPRHDLAALVP